MAYTATDRSAAAGTASAGVGLGPAPGLERPASLGHALRGLWTDTRGLVREHAALAVLEAQRAGMHLAYVLASVLVVSVLAVTAWLAIVTALIVWLAGEDVPWPGVLLIAAFLNLLGAAIIGWWARRQLTDKPFAATLRQLSADRQEISVTGNHAYTSRP
jgi:uncharacterized membrane protein YqjE